MIRDGTIYGKGLENFTHSCFTDLMGYFALSGGFLPSLLIIEKNPRSVLFSPWCRSSLSRNVVALQVEKHCYAYYQSRLQCSLLFSSAPKMRKEDSGSETAL